MDLLKWHSRIPPPERVATHFLLGLGAAGSLAASSAFLPAIAEEPSAPALVRVIPALMDSVVVCTLETDGLPGSRSLETLASGLPSSLTIVVSLLDGEGKEQTRAESEIRMVPDPLEGHITLDAPFWTRRAPSLAGLSEILHAIGPLPVTLVRSIPAHSSVTLRARVRIHPLAPSTSRRVQGMVGKEEEGSRREFSIGIGSLLRYFLGQRPEERWDLERSSPPFRREDLQALGKDP